MTYLGCLEQARKVLPQRYHAEQDLRETALQKSETHYRRNAVVAMADFKVCDCLRWRRSLPNMCKLPIPFQCCGR